MTKASDNVFPKVIVSEGAAPATPSASQVKVYAKSDGLMYSKDDAGTETLMSSGLASVTSTAPTFVAAGTSATGTGDVIPGVPSGHTTNDILVLLVQTNNQTAAAPAGYTQMGPAAGIGTTAVAGATRLTAFWKRDGGSETDPTVVDTGDHTLAQIIGIRGCPTTGDPFRNVGTTAKRTASTTGTGSAGATPADNCLVLQAFAHGLDSASAVFSSWTNASLSAVTERVDVATADGNGGGIGAATGLLATVGAFVATTVTETSTTDVGLAWYFLPSGWTNKGNHVDRQIFLTPGLADTWTKPSGAKMVDIIAIGGGGSGSAGRNAATAAGGGGGGGGAWNQFTYAASQLTATLTVTAGAAGAATAHVDGTVGNNGGNSLVSDGVRNIAVGALGVGGAASASGAGGDGARGGAISSTAAAASSSTYDMQAPGGGTGGTTAGAGGSAIGLAGGAGAGGGTTQATSAGGPAYRGGAGGGGGRSNTNVGTGGAGFLLAGAAGGASASANGTDAPYPEAGGGGGAGGTSASGTGGTGGWPGGGGGGGGSQSGAQGGGKGGDGVVIIVTTC